MPNKLYIPEKYLAYEHIAYINQISKPLFDRYAIILIDYARIYYDASWLFFTNQSNITQYFFDAGSTFLPYVNIQKQQSFCFVSTLDKFKVHLSEIKENFAIDNIFAYIDKQEKYVDVYWFGAHRNRPGMINFYVNNLDLIKNYAEYFQDKAQSLIKNAEKNKIIIPANMERNYTNAFEKIKRIKNKNEFYIEDDNVNITPREMECLQLIIKGFSAKMVANKLFLSVRTIETHLDNIKRKLNCTSKEQLIEVAFNYFIESKEYFN